MILSKLYFFLYYYTEPVFSKLPLYFPEKDLCSEGPVLKKNYDFIRTLLFFFYTFLCTYPFLVNYLLIFSKNGLLKTFATRAFFLKSAAVRDNSNKSLFE